MNIKISITEVYLGERTTGKSVFKTFKELVFSCDIYNLGYTVHEKLYSVIFTPEVLLNFGKMQNTCQINLIAIHSVLIYMNTTVKSRMEAHILKERFHKLDMLIPCDLNVYVGFSFITVIYFKT